MESGGGKGQVESLWGRIRVSEMGSRVARERPAIGALPSSAVGGGGGGAVRGKRSLLEAAGALSGTSYRPRTKETNAAWEYLLAFVAARLGGGEEREVLGAAAEECLAVLKREDMRDLDKKELLEKTLGIGMDADAYAQLVNLTKRITDFVVAAQGASRVSVAAGQEDDEKGGVAVVFEEDEDEEAAADLVAGEDDEEVEAEMESMIPTIRFEDAQPAATTTVALSEDEDYGGAAVAGISSKMDVDDAEAHLDAVDLELLAFPNGTFARLFLGRLGLKRVLHRRPHDDQQKVHRAREECEDQQAGLRGDSHSRTNSKAHGDGRAISGNSKLARVDASCICGRDGQPEPRAEPPAPHGPGDGRQLFALCAYRSGQDECGAAGDATRDRQALPGGWGGSRPGGGQGCIQDGVHCPDEGAGAGDGAELFSTSGAVRPAGGRAEWRSDVVAGANR